MGRSLPGKIFRVVDFPVVTFKVLMVSNPSFGSMILLKSYRATLLSSCAATFRRFRAMVNLAKETASSRLILAA